METFRSRLCPATGHAPSSSPAKPTSPSLTTSSNSAEISLEGPETHTLIIDMAALTFIDSSAISALIKLRAKAEDSGKKLTLTRVPHRVLRVLEIAGLGTVFTIE